MSEDTIFSVKTIKEDPMSAEDCVKPLGAATESQPYIDIKIEPISCVKVEVELFEVEDTARTMDSDRLDECYKKEVVVKCETVEEIPITPDPALQQHNLVQNVSDTRVPENLSQCDQCKETLPNESHLKSHTCQQSKEHEKQLTCQMCNKSFFLVSSLRRHILRVHNINGHICRHKTSKAQKSCHICYMCNICNICEVRFPCKSELDFHLSVHHHRSELFTCEFCNKQFISLQFLKRHFKDHEGFEINIDERNAFYMQSDSKDEIQLEGQSSVRKDPDEQKTSNDLQGQTMYASH